MSKALKWNKALISGQIDTMKALAETEGVTQHNIAHLIKLAWLSPDIMQAISGATPGDTINRHLEKGLLAELG